MATVTFTLTGGEGSQDFKVVLIHPGATTASVSGTTITTMQCFDLSDNPLSGLINLGVSSRNLGRPYVALKADASPQYREYVQYATENSDVATVRPSTGYSFDLWYPFTIPSAAQGTVLAAISGGSLTYAGWQGAGPLTINPSFWTVFYDYAKTYPIAYKRGATCTVTTV